MWLKWGQSRSSTDRNCPSMRTVDVPRWGTGVEWQGLEEFLAADAFSSGVHRIKLMTSLGDPLTLDLYIHIDQGSPMTVHFYGAQGIPRKDTNPIFGALPTSQSFETSYVLVHDPTLSLSTEIGLAWFEGYKGFAAAPTIRTALGHLAEVARAPRTVLWGGSAGGYAVLRHVSGIPGAVGFVWNPQTAITRYQPAPVRRYAQLAFGTDDLVAGAASTPGITVDLTTLTGRTWSDAPVVYLQEGDDRHVHQHLAYLLAEKYPEAALEVRRRDTMYGLLSPNLYLHQSLWEPGHSRPPKASMKHFLAQLLDVSRDVPQIFADLETASHDLLRKSREPHRSPVGFELNAPLQGSPTASPRVLQWGSRFGLEATGSAASHYPILVTRSVRGQSIITAFSVRSNPVPKTALDLVGAKSGEQRQLLLRDRRASASSAMREDPTIEVLVLDLLEEVRGTVNAGNGFIVTNHGALRRVDGSSLIVHEFGSERHSILWQSRLDRLAAAARDAKIRIVVLDIDATQLDDADWEWLDIPRPSADGIAAWQDAVVEAKRRIPDATWIPVDIGGRLLRQIAEDAGAQLSAAIVEAAESGVKSSKVGPVNEQQIELQAAPRTDLLEDSNLDGPTTGIDGDVEELWKKELDHSDED